MSAYSTTPVLTPGDYADRLAAEYLASFGGIPRHKCIDLRAMCITSVEVDNPFANPFTDQSDTNNGATVRPAKGSIK